jgi:hypothetical protein
MQRQVGASGAVCHGILCVLALVPISFFAAEMSTCIGFCQRLSMPWQTGAVI